MFIAVADQNDKNKKTYRLMHVLKGNVIALLLRFMFESDIRTIVPILHRYTPVYRRRWGRKEKEEEEGMLLVPSVKSLGWLSHYNDPLDKY
jgi:hypothetical protein